MQVVSAGTLGFRLLLGQHALVVLLASLVCCGCKAKAANIQLRKGGALDVCLKFVFCAETDGKREDETENLEAKSMQEIIICENGRQAQDSKTHATFVGRRNHAALIRKWVSRYFGLGSV